jgi:hypothetical protein
MSEDPPKVQWDEDVPDERPDDEGGEPEIHDQPLGVPEDADAGNAPLPGLPETEPPTGG